MTLTRRDFLRTGSLAVLGAAAAACGGGGAPRRRSGTLDDIIDGRPQRLQVMASPFDLQASKPERVVFGLQHLGGTRITGATGTAWIARQRDETAHGPFEFVSRDDGLDIGVYTSTITFPGEGGWLMLVEATPPDASEPIIGAIQIDVGVRTKQPKVGDRAIDVPTPTTRNARGVSPICSRNPACAMHRVSLDDALRSGKPTVLIIATPKFCRTALCGPEVDIVEQVSREFSTRANFIHVEVLANDDEQTVQRFAPLAPAAAAWHLEVEPATYFIDADGTIVDRFVGPMDRTEARDAARALVS